MAKVFESLVLKWVDICVKLKIDDRQFGGMPGTTTDVLIEMLHKWYEATDVTDNFVRVLFLDYGKAFDLINLDMLIDKLVKMELPAHLVRWMAAFLLDREQRVKIRDAVSRPGYPNGGIPRELCLDLNTFWSISTIYEHLALSTNM